MSSSRGPAGSAGRRALTIRSERGSAGVWVLALSGVILLSGAASVLAGMAIISRHEAGTAADLAALAAASRAFSGPEVACAAGQDIADANGAELVSCTLSADGVVDVTVTVTVQFGSLGLGVARADARAGPAGTGGPAGPDQPLVDGLAPGSSPRSRGLVNETGLRVAGVTSNARVDQGVENRVQDRDRRLLVQWRVAVAALGRLYA